MTGRGMITEILKTLGAVAPGESCTASEAVDGLAVINRMISSWSTEGLLIYTRTREAVALTPGTASYTMGTSGTYSSTRAQAIEEALIRDETVSPAIESPVEILSLEQWVAIQQKDTTAALPTSLYHDGGYPLETITLYPKPTVAHKLVLYSLKPLSALSLDVEVSLPPGYEEALIFNGAMRLAPQYGKVASNEVVMVATEAKAGLKRANQRPAYLSVDAALVLPRRFNIYTGDN
jgi:hypothetical protein